MKIFIDLGAYDGDTITKAMSMYHDFDKFYGFEPDPDNFKKLSNNFSDNKKVLIFNKAAYISNQNLKFFHHIDHGKRTDAYEGGTLESTKRNVSKDNYTTVQSIDFSEFIQSNFSINDQIILKIDIEGTEYELLNHLINKGTIKYIDKIFCEWHKHKIKINLDQHEALINKLRGLGFNITGDNEFDEFSKISNNQLLTVVIATYNRSNVLKELLESLKNQTDKNFEVIVAIDGSTDNTTSMLEDFKKTSPYEIKWINTGLTTEYGLATARNMGIKEASGEIVVVIDDDSFPVPEFVAEHKKTVHNKTLTGGARLSNDPNDNLEEKNNLYLDAYGDSKPQKIVPIPKYKWIVENNTCMYKKDWLDSGLFDESIKAYGGIGQEFNKQIIKRGFMYQFNPRAAIVHKTEYRQNHLYKKIVPSRNVLRNILKNKLPAIYNIAKKIKNFIEYR